MGIFGRDEKTPDLPQKPTRASTTVERTPAPVADGSLTVIARANRVEGKILGSGDLKINGEVQGQINLSALVRITEHGRVKGKVHARIVAVAGTVEGDVTADERIELAASAHVDGNMTAPRIQIEDGANFEGQVVMREPDKGSPGGPGGTRKMFESKKK